MKEDGVLDLSKCRLLNPNLPVEDFAYHIALLVLGDPWLVLVGIAATKCVERVFLHLEDRGGIIVFGKKLPWAEMTMVHAVKDDAHALPSGKEGGDTEGKPDGREDTPASSSVTQDDEDSSKDAT